MNIIEPFKKAAKSWATNVVNLYNTEVRGDLEKEKQSLLKYAKYIKKGVESIFGALDELEGLQLGLAPAIPAAVIAASMAAIYKWNRDHAKFIAKLNLHNKVAGDTGSIEAANKAVEALDRQESFKTIQTYGGLALLAGTVFLIAKRFN